MTGGRGSCVIIEILAIWSPLRLICGCERATGAERPTHGGSGSGDDLTSIKVTSVRQSRSRRRSITRRSSAKLCWAAWFDSSYDVSTTNDSNCEKAYNSFHSKEADGEGKIPRCNLWHRGVWGRLELRQCLPPEPEQVRRQHTIVILMNTINVVIAFTWTFC